MSKLNPLVLEDDIVPGTIHLVDVENNLNVQKGHGGLSDIILQPQPSDNVNDPLRWSQLKKNLQFTLLFVWLTFLAVTVNWTGPYWTVWTEEFNCTFDQLNISSALCFLFLGLGCLFLQPTAMKLGRRFVYLMCTVLALVANIVGMYATNIQFLYALNAILGFAAAPVDSLVEISSTDVFFTHERAAKLSWLILALYFGSDIGPVVAGYLPTWQWGYRLQVIIFAVLLVVQLFLMEDTTFRRDPQSTEENILTQIRSHEIDLEKAKSADPSVKNDNVIVSRMSSSLDESPLVGTKRTYWKRMQLIEREFALHESWFMIFIRPFYLLPLPAVIWGGIVYGAQMMWLSLLATTQSQIFVSNYNFSVSATGLTNLAPLGGSIVGMFYGGAFVDWLSVKLARRNNGIMEPEFRLWAMLGPLAINAAGLLAYGLAPGNGAPWAIPVVLGQGFLGFAMSSSGPVCLAYAIESYPELASEALVLMLFVRNMIGCGFTFAIQGWIDRDGIVLTTWLMFMLSVVINGSFVIFIFWGKRIRRLTKNYYYKIAGGHLELWK